MTLKRKEKGFLIILPPFLHSNAKLKDSKSLNSNSPCSSIDKDRPKLSSKSSYAYYHPSPFPQIRSYEWGQ